MIYLQTTPAAPLSRFVGCLWYASGEVAAGRQRILPTGNTQILLSLSRDYLLDCLEWGAARETPGAQVVGARSTYEIIDNSDLTCLIGMVFRPGGFQALMGMPADLFANRSVGLENLWGSEARSLRERLLEAAAPVGRLACLEAFLQRKLMARGHAGEHPAVRFALEQFGRNACALSVAEVARATGWSERRFSQIFREQVGLTPKVWCRVQRFQSAVRALQRGADVRWGELALDCGYYDQSHFANEFRAFSGIDLSSYRRAARTRWANHIVER